MNLKIKEIPLDICIRLCKAIVLKSDTNYFFYFTHVHDDKQNTQQENRSTKPSTMQVVYNFSFSLKLVFFRNVLHQRLAMYHPVR